MKKYVLIFIALATLFLSIPSTLRAQGISLSVSPPILQSIIKPGKSIMVAYTITNLGDPVVVKSYIRSFKPEGYNGSLKILPTIEGPIRFSLDNSDLSLNKSYLLQSKDNKQILLRMRVPEKVPAGDYYYTLLTSTDTKGSIGGNTSALNQATIGSTLLFTITDSGITEVQGSIAHFSIKPLFILDLFGKKTTIVESTDPLLIQLIVQNAGTNLFTPEGTIDLIGSLGDTHDFFIRPDNVLSNSSRMLIATPSAQIVCQNKHCDNNNTLMLKGLFIGKYNVRAKVILAMGSQVIYKTISFIAIPFKLILALTIAFSLSILLIRYIKKTKL